MYICIYTYIYIYMYIYIYVYIHTYVNYIIYIIFCFFLFSTLNLYFTIDLPLRIFIGQYILFALFGKQRYQRIALLFFTVFESCTIFGFSEPRGIRKYWSSILSCCAWSCYCGDWSAFMITWANVSNKYNSGNSSRRYLHVRVNNWNTRTTCEIWSKLTNKKGTRMTSLKSSCFFRQFWIELTQFAACLVSLLLNPWVLVHFLVKKNETFQGCFLLFRYAG